MDVQLDAIVRALDARKSGEGYAAKCPAHKDHKPSLSISKPNGKVLLKCHTGCTQDAVIDALQARGVWPKAERKIMAEYDYIDADGVLVFQAVRYEPKDFRQRRPDGMGEWIWNLRGVKVVPYNLPNVIQAIARGEAIAIVEGEKDVENLRKIGVTATANAGGAGKWRRDHSEYLRGAKVIILPDNDEPGRAHAKQVSAALVGIAAEAKIIELPGLPEKGDVSDWLAKGGTADALDALCASASAVTPAPSSRFPRVWLDDARFDPACDYFIKGLLEPGLIVIYGPSGGGKTFVTLDLICHVAASIQYRGRRVRQAIWVYVAAEAGRSATRRFYAWSTHHLAESREGRIPLLIIPRGINLLNQVEVEAFITELRQISVDAGMPIGGVVFDTLSRSTPGADENSAEDMSRPVGVADLLRDELGASTAFVHHSGKDASKGPRGSNALFAAADTVILVSDRVITVEKSRDGASGEQFPFDLKVIELGEDQDGDKVTTCVVVPSEAAPQKRQTRPLSGVASVALNALHEAIGEHGRAMPGTSTIPAHIKAVTLEQWRSRFTLRYGSDADSGDRGASAVRKAFIRGREALIGSDAIKISDPYVWPVRAKSIAFLSVETS